MEMERLVEYNEGNLKSRFENLPTTHPGETTVQSYFEVDQQEFNNHSNLNIAGDTETIKDLRLLLVGPLLLLVIAAVIITLLTLFEKNCIVNKHGPQSECWTTESENAMEVMEIQSESSLSIKSPAISTKSWVQRMEVSVIQHSYDDNDD